MGYHSVFAAGLFKGQTYIVTGGGSGIGRCTAHELAALGANVVIAGLGVWRRRRRACQVSALCRVGQCVGESAPDIRGGTKRDACLTGQFSEAGPWAISHQHGGALATLLCRKRPDAAVPAHSPVQLLTVSS